MNRRPSSSKPAARHCASRTTQPPRLHHRGKSLAPRVYEIVLGWDRDPVLTERYRKLIDDTVAAPATAGNVYRVRLDDLRASRAVLALAIDAWTGQVVAGAHAVRTAPHEALIQGVVTRPSCRRRGYAKRVVATLIRWLYEVERVGEFALVVRLFRGDVPNAGAYALFTTAFGFVPGEPVTYRVEGSWRDRHLDDEGTGCFRALPLHAGRSAVNAARSLLSET